MRPGSLTLRNVPTGSCGVVVPGDDPVLIREDELGPRPPRADEAAIIARSDDRRPAVAHASHDTMALFSTFFGIPLSVLSILTGVVLGVTSKWGVFRTPWVTAKLALIVSVMVVGALLIGPSEGDPDRETLIIAGAAYDVVALSIATGLSVFKPGGRRRAYPR
jgi:uncharacterized membrane protein SirB2